MFGITGKLDTIIQISSTVENAFKNSPFPTPTSYAYTIRHYLNTTKIPSRQDLKSLKVFAPSAYSRSFLDGLANDVLRYKTIVVDAHLILVDVLDIASSNNPKSFQTVPFALLIDFFERLQPRFYSISFSNSENPSSVSATCVTLQYQPRIKSQRIVYSLNTNYLWSMHEQSEKIKNTLPIHYLVSKEETRLPIYIRQANNFKIPPDISLLLWLVLELV
jgi:NADPH-ferrihemoprotein reductase